MLIVFSILVSSIIYTAIMGRGFFSWSKLFLWSVFVECIASGLVVATFLWIVTNQWMIRNENYGNGGSNGRRWRRFSAASSDNESIASDDSVHHRQAPDVEWAYAFDIHLNAFFPCIIILRIIQPMFIFCKFPYYILGVHELLSTYALKPS